MSSPTPGGRVVPLYARASRWRDGDAHEVALLDGIPHRRARGPRWIDRLLTRTDRVLGHSAHHHRTLAQVTLLTAVVAWWFPGVVAAIVLTPIITCWGYVALERAARRWVRWVPVPWDDEVRRYAARAAVTGSHEPGTPTKGVAGN